MYVIKTIFSYKKGHLDLKGGSELRAEAIFNLR